MNAEAQRIRRELAETRLVYDKAVQALRNLEATCHHNWGPTTDDRIYHKAYHIPGDPPGTMGVDRELPMDVPARTENRWKRVCEHCGLTEHTQKTKPHTTHEPIF